MTSRTLGLVFAFVAALCCGTTLTKAASSQADFFERQVRPILANNCYRCHSSTSPRLRGGLSLESREAALRGGKDGPVIVPGNPEQSLLIKAVRYVDKDLQMPPRRQLPPAAVAVLEQWIRTGAFWPGASVKLASTPTALPAFYDKVRQEHWAWQPVKTVRPPDVKDAAWPTSDIDRFILADLESHDLHPVGPADKYSLIRRVTFDLTGLPPTPQEIDAFVRDSSANAYETLVDRLLASPAFGERWGRHWLDVARYADSTGSSRNFPFEFAWRYRNYVIDSFNADKPYNRFIAEQIAGDLLPSSSVRQRDEQKIATGFLALGIKDLNEKDQTKFLMDNVDEQIDVTSKAILGLTISCARCHDHKFDPIPQSDYYKLAGIFRSTQILCGLQARQGGGNQNSSPALLLQLSATPSRLETPEQKASREAQIKQLTQQLDEAQTQLQRIQERGQAFARQSFGSQDPTQQNQALLVRRRRLVQLRQEINRTRAELSSLQAGQELAIGVRDAMPGDSPIYNHGDPDDPGPQVRRGMISLCRSVYATPISPAHSGRLELARWLVSADNPLTTRVVVNRIWHYLFGQGIVRTVDNFGSTGEAPSNPQLLDYLARRFVQQGWSVKKMVRELVLTRTYQLAATCDPSNAAIDPGDRYLWRMAPRRLEAEEIRDAVLAAAGTLDSNRPAGSPVLTLPSGEIRGFDANQLLKINYLPSRSVYLPVLRGLVPDVLEHFDFASPEMVVGDREITTVAPQALFMMNDPFILEQSRMMAERLLTDRDMEEPARIALAYRLAVGRPASDAEVRRGRQYLTREGAGSVATMNPQKTRIDVWAGFCQALMASAEFRYLD